MKLKKKFDFCKIIDEQEVLPLKKKVNKKGKINCSSNEMIHPYLSKLNDMVIDKIDLGKENSYIYYPEKIKLFSELLGIDEDRIQLYAGSDDAIKYVLLSFHNKCSTLIIQDPNYENYYSYASLNGYKVIRWKMNSENLSFDLDDGINILNANENNSIVVITSPNGFTGKLTDYSTIYRIAQECYEKNDILVIDQAYLPFAEDLNYREIANEFENVILISTLSKGHGLAGARFAYINTSPILSKCLARWNGINAISAFSYDISEQYIRSNTMNTVIKDIVDVRNRFIDFITNDTPWETYISDANFVLIKLENAMQARDLSNYLFENDIIVRRLDGIDLDSYIRITCIFEMEIVIKAIKKYLRNHSSL